MQTTSKTILQINSSARSNGNANALADQFVGEWLATHTQDRPVKRDVGANPLPHLTEELIGAFFTPAEQRTADHEDGITGTRVATGGRGAPETICEHGRGNERGGGRGHGGLRRG